jgi:hypothetical protein
MAKVGFFLDPGKACAAECHKAPDARWSPAQNQDARRHANDFITFASLVVEARRKARTASTRACDAFTTVM